MASLSPRIYPTGLSDVLAELDEAAELGRVLDPLDRLHAGGDLDTPGTTGLDRFLDGLDGQPTGDHDLPLTLGATCHDQIEGDLAHSAMDRWVAVEDEERTLVERDVLEGRQRADPDDPGIPAGKATAVVWILVSSEERHLDARLLEGAVHGSGHGVDKHPDSQGVIRKRVNDLLGLNDAHRARGLAPEEDAKGVSTSGSRRRCVLGPSQSVDMNANRHRGWKNSPPKRPRPTSGCPAS